MEEQRFEDLIKLDGEHLMAKLLHMYKDTLGGTPLENNVPLAKLKEYFAKLHDDAKKSASSIH